VHHIDVEQHLGPVSQGSAREFRAVRSASGAAKPDAPALTIAALDQIAADEAELDGLCEGHPIFRIAYEELADEPRLVELQRFLGLDPEPLRSWFERLRTRPLSETVSNWDEITTALTGGPYEGFLEADG
jgi:hypothetical protein